MKNIFFLITLLVISLFSCKEKRIPSEDLHSNKISQNDISSQTPVTEQVSAGSEQYKEVVIQGVTFRWKLIDKNLKVIVRAPTTGWVAVGFDPEFMMQSADIIIGFVKDGKVFVYDHFAYGPTSHKSDEELGGKDNIIEKSGVEENGETEISFTIPLFSGDTKDKKLEVGKEYKVILAYGKQKEDNTSSYHALRTSTKIKI